MTFRTDTPRWQPWFGIGAALLALALAIGFTRAQLRDQIREQLARRDGRILASLLEREMQMRPDDELADPLLAALDAALVPGVPGLLAIRLYDPNGGFFAALTGPTNAVALPGEVMARLDAGVVSTEFDGRPGSPLRVYVPLPNPRGAGRLGFVAYDLDGAPMAREFAELDAHLGRQAILAFLLAGAATAGALGWAFRRLSKSNRLLADRTVRLQRANEELTLAAKTSAVGAVASHLVHGLKNPVLALQQFVAAQGDGTPADWQDAAATAGRLRRMIDDVVRVLREEQHLNAFEVAPDELASILRQRFAGLAEERGLRIGMEVAAGPALANREANLVLLILDNLLTNAVQASPPGGVIRVACRPDGAALRWEVSDEGPGIPAEERDALFRPGRTTKAGGTGLGLVISRQLARHLGGDLDLAPGPGPGARFVLTVPMSDASRSGRA